MESAETNTRNDQRRAHLLTTALSAWDLQRSASGRFRDPRARQMVLKTHERVRWLEEAELGVPRHQGSFFLIGPETAAGVLLIHDTHQSPADLRALGHALGQEGMTVHAVLLAGHGLGLADRVGVRWRSSSQQIRLAHRLLSDTCSAVHVVGVGFGAVLALHLASRERVAGLVLIAPALIPQIGVWQRLLWRLRIMRLGPIRKRMGQHMDAVEGMQLAQNLVGKLRLPIYGVQCDDDQEASPLSLRFLQKRARHPRCRFQAFPSGGHDVLTAHRKSGLDREIIRFIKG
jgi:carboxylesterase